MYEPELKYCPRCEDEYRAEIGECAACACELLTGVEMATRLERQESKVSARRSEIGADDNLITVRRGPLAEIRTYEKLLKREGIATVLAGDENSCRKGCCPGNVDLLVRSEDGGDAAQIITAEIRRTSLIDTDAGINEESVFDPLSRENTCPACGHRFTGGLECPDCGLCF